MTNSLPYPEQRPSDPKPLKSFRFTTTAMDHAKVATESRLAELEEEIRTEIEKCLLTYKNGNKIPGLEMILNITHDRDELLALAKGLRAVANRISKYDAIMARKNVLELAEKDVDFFAWAFSDVSEDVDTFLNDLSENVDEQ